MAKHYAKANTRKHIYFNTKDLILYQYRRSGIDINEMGKKEVKVIKKG